MEAGIIAGEQNASREVMVLDKERWEEITPPRAQGRKAARDFNPDEPIEL